MLFQKISDLRYNFRTRRAKKTLGKALLALFDKSRRYKSQGLDSRWVKDRLPKWGITIPEMVSTSEFVIDIAYDEKDYAREHFVGELEYFIERIFERSIAA